MDKSKKKMIILIVLIALMLVVTIVFAKIFNQDEDKKNGADNKFDENSVAIYYVEDTQIESRDELYQLKQPDILSSSVEELITAMTEDLQSKGFEISSFMLNSENTLNIVMVKPKNITTEDLLLVKASVCNTLFQLKELDVIKMTINDEKGKMFSDEMFDENSFYIYNER